MSVNKPTPYTVNDLYCDIIISVELLHDAMRILGDVALSSMCNSEVGITNF